MTTIALASGILVHCAACYCAALRQAYVHWFSFWIFCWAKLKINCHLIFCYLLRDAVLEHSRCSDAVPGSVSGMLRWSPPKCLITFLQKIIKTWQNEVAIHLLNGAACKIAIRLLALWTTVKMLHVGGYMFGKWLVIHIKQQPHWA